MTEESLNSLAKIPVVRERLTMSVIVGRSIGKDCFRIDVGMGSKITKMLGD